MTAGYNKDVCVQGDAIRCRRLKMLGLNHLTSPGQCLKRLLSDSCFSDLKPLLEHFSCGLCFPHVFLTPLPLFTVSADIPLTPQLLCSVRASSPQPSEEPLLPPQKSPLKAARPLRHSHVPGLPAQMGVMPQIDRISVLHWPSTSLHRAA